jgi:DNA polymerase III gamma/tau subunit
MSELYKDHRPTLFKQVKGQPEAVKMVGQFLKNKNMPHAILFSGASGCGKTTLARIAANKMACHSHDLHEINAANVRGIDDIRKIDQRMNLAPLDKCRIHIIDECHQLTKDAQSALLKMLEDPPSHVYFFLCTTNREKMMATIKTRCTDIMVRSLSTKEMMSLLRETAKKEKRELTEEVMDKIIDKVEGSPRKALVLLEQVFTSTDEDGQLEIIEKHESHTEAIQIARTLINPRSTFKEVMVLFKAATEDPESLRRMILGYAGSILISAKNAKMMARSYLIIDCLAQNVFDSGKAGLAASIYEIYHGE